MIKIPEVKFSHSVNISKVDPGAMADWLEACLLFSEAELSKSDVVDILIENLICADDNQDLAYEIAENGWNELKRRKRWGGTAKTLEITPRRISLVAQWQEEPLQAFFIILSLFRLYPNWAKQFNAYAQQGELFEKAVEIICPGLLPGWEVYRAGWSPNNTQKLPDIISDLAGRLGAAGAQNPDDWLTGDEKDSGLDLVCYRSFNDEREAAPVFFLQCASGKNWNTKIHTPDAKLWQKLLDTAVEPSIGFVAPFVIEPKVLKISALKGQLVMFDRIRLIQAANKYQITPEAGLQTELLDWVSDKVEKLPFA